MGVMDGFCPIYDACSLRCSWSGSILVRHICAMCLCPAYIML